MKNHTIGNTLNLQFWDGYLGEKSSGINTQHKCTNTSELTLGMNIQYNRTNQSEQTLGTNTQDNWATAQQPKIIPGRRTGRSHSLLISSTLWSISLRNVYSGTFNSQLLCSLALDYVSLVSFWFLIVSYLITSSLAFFEVSWRARTVSCRIQKITSEKLLIVLAGTSSGPHDCILAPSWKLKTILMTGSQSLRMWFNWSEMWHEHHDFSNMHG